MALLWLIFSTMFSTNDALITVSCVGTDACRYQTLSCANTPDVACLFDCNGPAACQESIINCLPVHPYCIITCNGWDSCRSAVINGQQATELNVIGETVNQYLHSATINCPTDNVNGKCLVRCEGTTPAGCVWITINAQNASKLDVEVESGATAILASSNIYCPTKRGSCKILIPDDASTGMIAGMKIYAAESFYDVNITCAISSDPSLCDGATLHCTSNYNQQCILKRYPNQVSQWNCTNKQFCKDYSYSPTASPVTTYIPSQTPSAAPVFSPSKNPTDMPTEMPTDMPTEMPTEIPTTIPTPLPTLTPFTTKYPSQTPTVGPSNRPTPTPTNIPTNIPSNNPIVFNSPTDSPITNEPTYSPITSSPTYNPTTKIPTNSPTLRPTNIPTTNEPTSSPTLKPTNNPSITPTYSPSNNPSKTPTNKPTKSPTLRPTKYPTAMTIEPTLSPSFSPSQTPTDSPSSYRDNGVIFDSFFIIKYLIKKLENIYIETLVENIIIIVSDMTNIIEEAYYEVTGLKIRFFSLEIQQILNFKIKNINSDKYPNFLTSKDEISLSSRIECDKISCQVLLNDDFTEDFEAITQTKLREYFTSYSLNTNAEVIYSQLIFEIASYGKLESIYKSDEINMKEMIFENKALLIVLFIMFLMCNISFFAFLYQKQFCCLPNGLLMDETLWYAPIFYGIQLSVLISDINLFISLVIDDKFITDIRITICGLICISFILIPYGINLYFSGKFLSMIPKENLNAISFFKTHTIVLNILIIISGGCFPTILLMSSSIFGVEIFNSGLLNNELKFMNKIKIFGTIFLQNIPQICIQCVYAASIHGINVNILFALIISILSIICTPFVLSNMNLKLTHFKYYMEIKLQNDQSDIYDQQTFILNRGKTYVLSELLCHMYGGSVNNIEISRNITVSFDEYSLTYYVTHFVNDDYIINCGQIIKLYMENEKLLKRKLKQEIFDLNGECIITFKSINGIYDTVLNGNKLLTKLVNENALTTQKNDGELEEENGIELQQIKHETYGNIDIEETISINEQIKPSQIVYDQSDADNETSEDISFNV